jgi:P pilus assembly chaperone PapD
MDSHSLPTRKSKEPRFADSYIRIAPRQVSLEAGERQKVRLFLRPKAGMENGEYRTHLLAVSLPDASTSGAANADKDEKDIVLQLPVAIGVSIPVLIRKGQLEATGHLDNLSIVTNDKGTFAEGLLHRKGNRSLYGDLNAALIQPGKDPKTIGFIKGVSVYTPNAARKIQVPVQMPAGSTGTLKVTFEEPASAVSNPQTITAEKKLP